MRAASGETAALSASRNSAVPDSITTLPGRNLRVAGFGVASVCMNMGTSERLQGPPFNLECFKRNRPERNRLQGWI
jgi:hypothetical protein